MGEWTIRNPFFFSSGEPFVLTPEGQRYAQVVKALRIRQLVMVPTDIDCLRRDNIVDPADISSAVSDRWERQLYLALPQNTGGALNRRATVNGQPPSQDGPSQVPWVPFTQITNWRESFLSYWFSGSRSFIFSHVIFAMYVFWKYAQNWF